MTTWNATLALAYSGGFAMLFAGVVMLPPCSPTQRRIALGVLAVGVVFMLPLFARLWVAALLGGA